MTVPAPGDRLLRIGAVVLAAGIVCTLIAILPFFLPGLSLPSTWWFLSMLIGVGLALVIAGLLRSSGSRRRR